MLVRLCPLTKVGVERDEREGEIGSALQDEVMVGAKAQRLSSIGVTGKGFLSWITSEMEGRGVMVRECGGEASVMSGTGVRSVEVAVVDGEGWRKKAEKSVSGLLLG